MLKYPTIESLASADPDDIVPMIHKLGFQNQRAKKCVELARAWLADPPVRGKRYRKMNYPRKGDGRDIKHDEVLPDDDEDPRVAWEIANLPGLGAYALDSWRMFCRDDLRGRPPPPPQPFPDDPNLIQSDFEPEWQRTLPTDKELRAYMTWRWLQKGYLWNKNTGERKLADEDTMKRGEMGGVVTESEDGDYLVLMDLVSPVQAGRKSQVCEKRTVERTAGTFMSLVRE